MPILVPKIKKLVQVEQTKLIREQISPWVIGFAVGKLSSTDFYGKRICYEGVSFDGSPAHVFWSNYIEPYIENIIERLSSQVIQESSKNNLNVAEELKFLQTCLNSMIMCIYDEMAIAEQRMLANGVSKRRTLSYVEKEKAFLQTHIDMEIAKLKSRSKNQKSSSTIITFLKNIWHDPVWSKVLAAVILASLGLFTLEEIKSLIIDQGTKILSYIPSFRT